MKRSQRSSLPIIVLFIVTSLLTSTRPAEARVWRCEGKVQFRPCEQIFSIDANRNTRAQAPVAQAHSMRRAGLRRLEQHSSKTISVLKQKYRRISTSVGHWYGRVKGSGSAHLYLDIFHKGIRVSERYMGNVALTPADKAVSFNFKGPLPRVRGWTWKVRVKAV